MNIILFLKGLRLMYQRYQRWMLIINNRFLSLYDYNFLHVIEKIRKRNSKICGSWIRYLFLLLLEHEWYYACDSKIQFHKIPGQKTTCNLYVIKKKRMKRLRTRRWFPKDRFLMKIRIKYASSKRRRRFLERYL